MPEPVKQPIVKSEEAPKKETAKKIGLTQAERDGVKEKLTDANGKADEQQITALKNALSAYKEKAEDKAKAAEYITKLAVETVSFTKLTKVRWEEVMNELREMMA